MRHDDGWEPEDDELDLDDEDGQDPDDDESDTLPCPACGAEVYEDAEHCPECGTFITQATSAWFGKPWWWIGLGLLGIAAVVWASLP